MVQPTWGAVGTAFSASSATPAIDAPAGVAVDNIVVVTLFLDTSTVTVDAVPTGFSATPDNNVNGVNHRFVKYWKRSVGDGTDDDLDTYTFTLSASVYVEGFAERYADCITAGDPWDVTASAPSDGTSVSTSPAVSDVTTVDNTLLVHNHTNWSGGIATEPAGFTKRAQGGVGLVYSATKPQAVAGATGSIQSTNTNSDKMTAWLGALKGEPVTEAGANVSIPDEARSNMLTALVLTEPQLKSNVDLMKMVVDAGGLGLVTVTSESAAKHYWRYLKTLRDT